MKLGNTEFQTADYQINGVRLHVLTAGDESAKPILCLHGFPDTPHTFEHQFPVLLANGYRLVVPFLRGYPPSETGSAVDCFPLRLGEDAIELIDQLCDGKADILGHDWGALAAYGAALLAPEKIGRMVVSAVPPFKVFESSFGDMKQCWRSRYALFFQLGPLSSMVMRANNLASMDYLWSYWSPSWNYSKAEMQPLKDCLSQPGAMEAATRYYRALIWRSMTDRSFINLVMNEISVPTLLCQGDNDGCIGPAFFEDISPCFSGEWEKAIIPTAGHFMHRENPVPFNEVMLTFLQKPSAVESPTPDAEVATSDSV